MVDLVDVTCPACFQVFSVALPTAGEVPCNVDYDCEVCCRPMIIAFWRENGEAGAAARSLDE